MFFPNHHDILSTSRYMLAFFIPTMYIAKYVLDFIGLCSCTLTLAPFIFFIWIWMLRSRKVSPNGKAVLISGCDSGFGNSAAYKLHDLGFTVFAGCFLLDRNGEGARKLSEVKSSRMHVIQLDVTQQVSVEKAIDYVRNNLPQGSQGLWALLNNAGIAKIACSIEENISDVKGMMDVNCIGHVRMIKAFYPLVKKANGRIINVCSVLGRMGTVLCSSYCASKWAMRGFSQCLRVELAPKGIRVIIIDPGTFNNATNLFTFDESRAPAEDKQKYQDNVRMLQFICSMGYSDTGPVVDTMVDAVMSAYPATEYLPGTILDKIGLKFVETVPTFLNDLLFHVTGKLVRKMSTTTSK